LHDIGVFEVGSNGRGVCMYGMKQKRTNYCLMPWATKNSKVCDFEVVVKHEKVPYPFSFQSFSIILHANTSLIALQWFYTYLSSFPTQRLIVYALCLVHIPASFTPMQTATIVTDTLKPPYQ